MRLSITPRQVFVGLILTGLLVPGLTGCEKDKAVSDGDIPDKPVPYTIQPYRTTFIALNQEGGPTLLVRPGQIVRWYNDTAIDQEVVFDTTDKLVFGISSMKIPAKGTAYVQVLEDLSGDATHQHLFGLNALAPKTYLEELEKVSAQMVEEQAAGTSTEIPVGPPGIIVCPPGQPCG